MGEVHENTGFGRFVEHDGEDWRHVVGAWVGRGDTGRHTCDVFGVLTAGAVSAYQTAVGIAYSSGRTAWESHMASAVSGWSAWWGGLSALERDGVYEAARYAGQHSLTP